MFGALASRFRASSHGNVAIIFALSSTVLLVGAGSGIDLSRAYFARQKLSQVATLTCQFSTRPSVFNTQGANALYSTYVNQFASNELTTQNWPANSLPTGGPNGTSSTYFTSTGASQGNNIQASSGVAELWYNVPTTFLRIINVNQITVHAVANCQVPVNTNDQPHQTPLTNNTPVIVEGFETGQSGYYFTLPTGQTGTQSTPTQTFPATAGYLGDSGNQFYIMGYCLEIDAAGNINASTPQGTHSAELDCDNGNGSKGNSSISTKSYLATGYYELRYFYRSRVDYGNYDPVYICGSTASDLSWANDSGSGFNGQRTNQINAYLDLSVSNGPPPTHTTIDGSQQLAGSNLVDMCLYGSTWLERSVKIKITTAGYYWLSFAADGNNDSYGGQLDYIRLCVEQCAGPLQDNFPSSWLAANNGGTNVILFEDTFETVPPNTPTAQSSYLNVNGNLAKSVGTTTSSLSSCYSPFGTYTTPPGWQCQYAAGWGTAPYNQVNYFLQGAYQGAQYIAIDGDNSSNSSATTKNRLISRPFLLVPGYYNVSYDYISNVNFVNNGPYCFAAPVSGYIFPGPGNYASATGTPRFTSTSYTTDGSTNILGVFMSHGQLVSTPNVPYSPWATSNNGYFTPQNLGVATSYTNTDGSVTTTPTNPPDKVNWASYDATANNPVLDTCGYAYNYAWQPRSVNVKITKTAVYWLTFSSNGGLADGNGPGIDDVKLTALGSPYMTNPPTTPLVSIPTPSPSPYSNYTGPSGSTFNGFYIVADPFTPPASDQ